MPKRGIIFVSFRRMISEIKLKRTDTTLDLSQLAKRAGKERKEEEGTGEGLPFYVPRPVARAPTKPLVWNPGLSGPIRGTTKPYALMAEKGLVSPTLPNEFLVH